jgi:hypothetical protein
MEVKSTNLPLTENKRCLRVRKAKAQVLCLSSSDCGVVKRIILELHRRDNLLYVSNNRIICLLRSSRSMRSTIMYLAYRHSLSSDACRRVLMIAGESGTQRRLPVSQPFRRSCYRSKKLLMCVKSHMTIYEADKTLVPNSVRGSPYGIFVKISIFEICFLIKYTELKTLKVESSDHLKDQ